MESTDSQAIDTIDLSSIIAPLLGRWKLILICVFVGGTAGYLISRVVPRSYESSATVYARQKSAASALLQSLPMGIGSSGGDSSGYYITILQSESVLRTVVKQLRLRSRHGFADGKTLTLEEAARKLRECVHVKQGKAGGVSITARASSPELAAEIGNAMVDMLGRVAVGTSERKADFISTKLDETTRDLAKAEDKMRAFMETNDIAEIDTQTNALIGRISVLDGQMLSLDVELEQVNSRLANSGELDSLVDDQVRKKEIQASRDYVIAERERLQKRIDELPAVGVQYARLQRRIAVLSKTFEVLTQQYQLERITQQGEDGDYQIIDRAIPIRRAISPRGSAYAALGAMLGFALAALAACTPKPTPKYKKGH